MRSSGRRSEAVVKVACGVTQRWMCSLCRSPAGTIVKRADEDESRLGGMRGNSIGNEEECGLEDMKGLNKED